MADRDDRREWRRERSLLALGESLRGEDVAPTEPASSQASHGFSRGDDAIARHRMARARRYSEPAQAPATPARPAETEQDGPDEAAIVQEAEADGQVAGLSRFVPAWARLRRERSAEVTQPAELDDASREPATASEPSRPDQGARPVAVSAVERPAEDGSRNVEGWKPLIDPMKVFGGIFKSKLLIVAMTALGACLGVAVALSTPKKYEAFTELIVDPRDLKLTDKDLTQNVYASDATLAIVQNQVRVLTSGSVLNKVVEKLHLDQDPEFNGLAAGGGLVARIKALIPHHSSSAPAAGDEDRRWTLALNHLAEALSVDRAGQTFVVTVGVTTQDPQKSALIANTMTDVLLQTYGDLQADTAGRATDELSSRLTEMRKGVETAERKVEDFRATHDLIDAQGHLITDDQLLKLNDQLSTARAHTLELNAKAASARAANVDSVLGGDLPEELNSSTMSELRLQYAALKQEADSAAIRLGPRHPQLQALNAQLAGARDRIRAELKRIASSLQVDLKRAVQLEQDLSSRLAQAKVQSGDVNANLVTLRELEREANAKRTVYESFLVRAKETGEQKDINPANINVISKAYAPLDPLGPSRTMIALAGMLLGFAAGVGLGAMRGAYESLRDSAEARRRGLTPVATGDVSLALPVPPEAAGHGFSGGVIPADSHDDVAYEAKPEPGSAPFARQAWTGADFQAGFGQQTSQAEPAAYGGASQHPRRYDASHVSHGTSGQSYRRTPTYPDVPSVPSDVSARFEPSWRTAPDQPARAQPAGAGTPEPAADQASLEEIRASLREVREVVRELTENRARRRYF